MKQNDFKKIIQENNIHSTFLNEEGIVAAMQQSYSLGVKDVLDWLKNMNHISDNVEYLVEEWNNQHK